MKKVLVLSDSPSGMTGFGNVAKNILKSLHATGLFDITVVGINYDGEGYDSKEIPYKIIPATSGLIDRYRDVYGRQRCVDMLLTGEYDIFFTIQDMPVIRTMMAGIKKAKEKFGIKTIFYTPVDSALDTVPEWIKDTIPEFDFPVIYTEFGRNEVSQFVPKHDLRVILHGVDNKTFFPTKAVDRQKIFHDFFGVNFTDKEADSKFIIMNVNRNQIRKDYLRTFQAFRAYKEAYPDDNALLVCIAQLQDQGGDLKKIAAQLGLEYGVDWVTPIEYYCNKGYPVQILNLWYNMADVVFSSTLGEGFGLSSIEGMACGTPVVFPDNTSLPEILGYGDRGYLVACGDKPENWITFGAYDSSLVRPRINVSAAVDALKAVKVLGKDNERTKRALDWAKAMDWENVNKEWVKIFMEASK